MPRGAVPASPDRLADVNFTVVVEQAPFPLLRVVSDAPSELRAGFAGPLAGHEELLTEVAREANHRARMYGAPASIWNVHSWRFVTQVAPDDLELIRSGLERLLTGDEGMVRVFLSLPPIGPQDARKWSGSPDPHGNLGPYRQV